MDDTKQRNQLLGLWFWLSSSCTSVTPVPGNVHLWQAPGLAAALLPSLALLLVTSSLSQPPWRLQGLADLLSC